LIAFALTAGFGFEATGLRAGLLIVFALTVGFEATGFGAGLELPKRLNDDVVVSLLFEGIGFGVDFGFLATILGGSDVVSRANKVNVGLTTGLGTDLVVG